MPGSHYPAHPLSSLSRFEELWIVLSFSCIGGFLVFFVLEIIWRILEAGKTASNGNPDIVSISGFDLSTGSIQIKNVSAVYARNVRPDHLLRSTF